MDILFKIVNLHVHYGESSNRKIYALNGANLKVHSGEVLGLLGESGSGKSTIAKASMRLLPKGAQVTQGRIELEGVDLLTLTEKELQKVRGARIAVIPQEAGQSLNPVMKIGEQVAEVIRAHRTQSAKQCRQEAETLLQKVQLDLGNRRAYDAYPHQLSGGQQQRVAIAQALACQPALVIADEPTASLDPETAEEILQFLYSLKTDKKMSLLFITHDPKILLRLADRVAVMYAGRVIEEGSLEQIFQDPLHPYTKALLACLRSSSQQFESHAEKRLPSIEGSAPDPENVAAGCSFAPRCLQRMQICDEQHPALIEKQNGRQVECFLHGS
jgi:oligopeptide/dipeptide ABC transporter ATP-binding protein